MTDVHHFAYGWVNPILAYILSFLGSLLGLVLAARARDLSGNARVRWLLMSALAIGGTGIWLMHFMAMLGFDVPATVVRYDLRLTVVSMLLAVGIVAIGLLTVGFGTPTFLKIAFGGTATGVGVASMHYTGMAGVRVSGVIDYDPALVGMSFVIAVVASMVALWFAVVVRGPSATVGAALLMAVAVCSMHYTGMAAVRVRVSDVGVPVDGLSPFQLLAPIAVVASVVITVLAYSTIGYSMKQESVREEAMLARARDLHEAASLLRNYAGVGGRHR